MPGPLTQAPVEAANALGSVSSTTEVPIHLTQEQLRKRSGVLDKPADALRDRTPERPALHILGSSVRKRDSGRGAEPRGKVLGSAPLPRPPAAARRALGPGPRSSRSHPRDSPQASACAPTGPRRGTGAARDPDGPRTSGPLSRPSLTSGRVGKRSSSRKGKAGPQHDRQGHRLGPAPLGSAPPDPPTPGS